MESLLRVMPDGGVLSRDRPNARRILTIWTKSNGTRSRSRICLPLYRSVSISCQTFFLHTCLLPMKQTQKDPFSHALSLSLSRALARIVSRPVLVFSLLLSPLFALSSFSSFLFLLSPLFALSSFCSLLFLVSLSLSLSLSLSPFLSFSMFFYVSISFSVCISLFCLSLLSLTHRCAHCLSSHLPFLTHNNETNPKEKREKQKRIDLVEKRQAIVRAVDRMSVRKSASEKKSEGTSERKRKARACAIKRERERERAVKKKGIEFGFVAETRENVEAC